MHFTPEQLSIVHELATRFGWLMLVVVLDLALGVTVALKQRAFKLDKLADFIADYGPKIVGWLGLEMLGFLPADLRQLAGMGEALGTGAYAIIIISASASILGHAQALGLLPEKLNRLGIPPTNKEPNA
ncbi:MAG: hypothetical protein EHM48_00890 [Planctomycetaceae bacterium]|nr:MAG: hypothetical protein EHM48_00890 [Planctomycetaceae bacterium]